MSYGPTVRGSDGVEISIDSVDGTRAMYMGEAKAGQLKEICTSADIPCRYGPHVEEVVNKWTGTRSETKYPGRMEFHCPIWFAMLVDRVTETDPMKGAAFGWRPYHVAQIHAVLRVHDAGFWSAAFALGGAAYVEKLLDEVMPIARVEANHYVRRTSPQRG